MSPTRAPKLTQSVKALLKASSASPTPAPASAQSGPAWQALKASAERHKLSHDTWLTLSAAAVVTLNSPESFCGLYDFATSGATDDKAKAQTALLLRDVGLKAISFNGIPRTINALTALHAHLPAPLASSLPSTPTRTPSSTSSPSPLPSVPSLLSHGRTLWSAIYGPFADKLVAKLAGAHPNMPGYILAHHYGALLSTPLGGADDRVGRQLTSLVAVACLRAQGGVGAQLSSHVYGLRCADPAWDKVDDGNGAGAESGERWLSTNEGAEWVLTEVDKLVQVFGRKGPTFGQVKSKL